MKIWIHEAVSPYGTPHNQLERMTSGYKVIPLARYTTGRDIGWGRSYVNTTVQLHRFIRVTGNFTTEDIDALTICSGVEKIYTDRESYMQAANNVEGRANEFRRILKKYDRR